MGGFCEGLSILAVDSGQFRLLSLRASELMTPISFREKIQVKEPQIAFPSTKVDFTAIVMQE